ncbi:MAG: hypothetical protein U0931_15960 [Vulcanimicrobiota bacterium]
MMAGGFFHEMRQNANIGAAKAEAAQAQRNAEGAQDALRKLERRLETVVQINRALWSFVSDKLQISEAQLVARVQELGQAGSSSPAAACGDCGRPVGKSQARCMYCGTEKKLESIFDTL